MDGYRGQECRAAPVVTPMETELEILKAGIAEVRVEIDNVEQDIADVKAGRTWNSLSEREQDYLTRLQEKVTSLQQEKNILLAQLSTTTTTVGISRVQ